MDNDEINGRTHFERPTMVKPKFIFMRRLMYGGAFLFIAILAGSLGYIAFAPIYTQPLNLTQPGVIYSPITSLSDQGLAGQKASGLLKRYNQQLITLFPKTAHDTAFLALPDPSASVGTGVLITSDGWFAVASKGLNTWTDYEAYQGVDYLDIEKILYDDFTDLYYIKVNLVNQSPVLSHDEELLPGESIIGLSQALSGSPSFSLAYVGGFPYIPSKSRSDFIISTDSLALYYEVIPITSYETDISFFDYDGQFVGFSRIVDDASVLIPVNHILLSFEQSIRDLEEIDAGFSYILTAYDPGLGTDATGFTSAVVQSVNRGSLVAAAGLLKGDTIIMLNGQPMQGNELFDILWRKSQQGDSWVFTIEREGETIQLQV